MTTAFYFILVAAAFLSLVAQHFIPPLAFLDGARIFLMPLVLFYGALALPFGGMLFLALACGLMWDCLTVQVLEVGMGPTSATVVEIGLGWSIVLYALLGSVMSGLRPLFKRGRWEIHCLMGGVCTSLVVLGEFLMISVRRAALYDAPIVFTPQIWWRIGGPGLAAIFLAPVMFWILNSIAALVGFNPRGVSSEEN